MRIPLLAFVLLLALGVTAPAEEDPPEPRRIELPHAGFSMDVAPEWTVDQYAGPALLLTKADARLSVEVPDPAPASLAAALEQAAVLLREIDPEQPEIPLRPFPVFGADRGGIFVMNSRETAHMVGVFHSVHGGVIRVRGSCPLVKRTSLRESGQMVRSLDLTAYRHPERYVDNTAGGWTIDLPTDWLVRRGKAGVVILHPPRTLDVGLHVTSRAPDRGGPWIEAVGLPEAVRTVKGLTRTFRKGVDAGPRFGLPENRFPRSDCPPIRFALPEGWTQERPASSMRVVNLVLPGDPPVRGGVFFFGPGRGGGVAENVRNWKAQIEVEDELPEEWVFETDGLKITVLDIQGVPQQSAAGTAEAESASHHRMLAAIVEVEGGPLFLKIRAPVAPMREAAKAFRTWVESFRLEAGPATD